MAGLAADETSLNFSGIVGVDVLGVRSMESGCFLSLAIALKQFSDPSLYLYPSNMVTQALTICYFSFYAVAKTKVILGINSPVNRRHSSKMSGSQLRCLGQPSRTKTEHQSGERHLHEMLPFRTSALYLKPWFESDSGQQQNTWTASKRLFWKRASKPYPWRFVF